MKNCDQLSTMLFAQGTQDRQQAKRNATFLEAVVHIMQERVIVFSGQVVEQTIKRYNFKAGRFFRRRRFESGEHRVASEFHPQFFGNGKGIIADAIDSTRDPGNDLEERVQTETVRASPV